MNEQKSVVRELRVTLAGMLRLTAFIVIVPVTLGALGLSGVDTRYKLHAAEGSQQPDAPTPRRNLRIEKMREAQRFFEMIGLQAHCFRYEGAWVDCWIEVETKGKVTRLGEKLGRECRAYRQAATEAGRTFTKPSGRIVWVRRLPHETEVWDLAISVIDDGGNYQSTPCLGISPPQVDPNLIRRTDYVPHWLDGRREVVLITFDVKDSQTGQIVRSAKLKCRVVD